jgi:hypothetical protein
MRSGSFTCGACGDRTPDDNHSDYCEGSVDDRLRRLVNRIEALEKTAPRTVHKATINPTDTAQGTEVVGYYVDVDAARADVEGKSYRGKDGRVDAVTVIVDHDGNVFELSPSWIKLTPS